MYIELKITVIKTLNANYNFGNYLQYNETYCYSLPIYIFYILFSYWSCLVKIL